MLTYLTQEVSRVITNIVFTKAQQGRDNGDNSKAFFLLDKLYIKKYSLPTII